MAAPHDILNLAGGWNAPQLLGLYRAMLTAQTVDRIEQELCAAGEAFFQISGLGHEGAAALNLVLKPQDWIHPHYRDKALMIARGITPQNWFDSVLSNAGNYSHGRQMACFMADADLHIASAPIPVGANALQAVGIAAQVKPQKNNPIVVCGLGDGGTQQGEVMEAFAHAVREQLPVLFWIQDNGLAISTSTSGKTFYTLPGCENDRLFGMEVHHFDGRDILPDLGRISELADEVRTTRGPRLGVMRVERLASHSNADDQRVYRATETIEKLKAQSDPVVNMRRSLLEVGIDEAVLAQLDQQVEEECQAAKERARRIGDPVACHTAKAE